MICSGNLDAVQIAEPARMCAQSSLKSKDGWILRSNRELDNICSLSPDFVKCFELRQERQVVLLQEFKC
jgi:hypothetical protein